MVFSPFAVESLGGLGDGAIKFTNSLCHRLSGRRGETRGVTMGYIRQKLSVALHRSVARSILKRDVGTVEMDGNEYVGGGSVDEGWRINPPAAVAAVALVHQNVSDKVKGKEIETEDSSVSNNMDNQAVSIVEIRDTPVAPEKTRGKRPRESDEGNSSSANVAPVTVVSSMRSATNAVDKQVSAPIAKKPKTTKHLVKKSPAKQTSSKK